MTVFTEVVEDSSGVERTFLGPSYPYYKNIRLPNEIGVNSRGTMAQLGNNIQGLISYVEVLVSGNSRASATRGPLGNKFFLKTGAKCRDVETDELVERSIYVNNVPSGNIPFISGGVGVNFTNFRGLIPGTLGNLNALNPFNILSSFMVGSQPDCQRIRMQTIDINNNVAHPEQYVATVDIRNMDPCNFPNGRNPITNRRCRETFQGISETENQESDESGEVLKMPNDPLAQAYFVGLASVGVYIFYKIMIKSTFKNIKTK